MPISIAALRSKTRTATVKFTLYDEPVEVKVTYRPSGVTPEIAHQMRELRAGATTTIDEQLTSPELPVLMLAGVLVDWDVMDGEAAYPHDVEHLRLLDTVFLTEVVNGIFADSVPPKAS